MDLNIDWEFVAKLPPNEQEEIKELLQVLIEGSEQNPLVFFHPYPKQAEFLASRERFKWLLGGNRAGKTITCVVDDLIQALSTDDVPKHLLPYKRWKPPFKWRIVAMDFDQIELIVFEEIKRWVPPHALEGGTWKTAYSRERRVLRFANGSICQFKTYEQPAFNHGGASLHRVHFDEEPPPDIYDENRIRVVDFDGDIICAMTPVQSLTWMYDKFFVPWERGMLQNSFVQLVDIDDNPHISPAARDAALEEYSEEQKEARKTGRFVALHGRIYKQFTAENIIPRSNIPVEAIRSDDMVVDIPQSTWTKTAKKMRDAEEVPPDKYYKDRVPVYVGIDPGYRYMAAVVWAFHWYNDAIVVFHELAAAGKTVENICDDIHSVNEAYGITPAWYIMDPTCINVQHNTGRSLQAEYADYNIRAYAGQRDVSAGIGRVQVRLENQKLLVMDHCNELINEFRKYRWVKPQRKSENDAREAPVKKDDHLLDALRYICMARPYRPKLRKPVALDPLQTAITRDIARHAKKTRSQFPAWYY